MGGMQADPTPGKDGLDRTAKSAGAGNETSAPTPADAHRVAALDDRDASRGRYGLARIGGLLLRIWQFFIVQSFSSLTRRIVVLNVAGLLALSIGITFLSQFRAGLIDARVQSLLVQGQIIAGAIAASATVETD